MIKAIIFDMDGVLIDATEWHYEALNQALTFFGFEGISQQDHDNIYNGLPTHKKLDILSQAQGLPLNIHQAINEKKQDYTTAIAKAKCRPLALHQEALAALKAAGYKLAVASNSIRASVTTMLSLAQIQEYFDFMLSTADVTHPKPHPEIYLKAIAKLGVSPEECLVLEDNQNGVQAATSAGAHVMVIRNIYDVNLINILEKIKKIEQSQVSHETC